MRMIADKIIQFSPKLYISKDMKPSLKKIRLWCQNHSSVDSTTVYITHVSNIVDINFFKNYINVIVIGENDILRGLIDKSSSNIIILNSCFDIEIIINKIQGIFEFYNKWENELKDSVLNGGGFQALIDCSFKIFKNPMLLFDFAFTVIAWSKERSDSFDPIWSKTVEQGYGLAEIMNDAVNRKNHEYLDTITSPIFNFNDSLSRRSIVCNIRVNNKTVIRILIAEMSTKLNETHLYMAKLLKKYIICILQRDAQLEKSYGVQSDHFFMDQLEGKQYDIKSIKHYLQYLNWKLYDKYLLLIAKANQTSITNDTLEYYSNLIKNKLLGTYNLIYEKDIIIIINLSKHYFLQKNIINFFEEFLKLNNFRGGVSSIFESFLEIHTHYIQASIAVTLGTSIESKQYMYFYKDYAMYHMIHNCSKNVNLYSLCHPAVVKLLQYDNEYDVNYFNTLYVYLIKNKSLVNSAKVLNIHRNTFVYRINKILNLTNLDVEDENEILNVLMSYKIVEYINKMEPTSENTPELSNS